MKSEQKIKNQGISTIIAIFWNLISRFGTLGITFLSNVILARLLSPSDFGCIGILMVFVMLANTLLDGGLGAALIQKKHTEEIDYSTVFCFNICISVFLYLILYLFAPLISTFYEIPILTKILRVQGVLLIINAFRIIQYNILIKQINFKKIAYVEIFSSFTGFCIAIILAYYGFGVWSLVFNNLVASFLFTLILNITTKWRPSISFSKKSFCSLFSFGGLVLISNLIDTLYKNVHSLIIGKTFNVVQLGYYTQASKLENIPVTGLTSAVSSVFFPVFSKLQDNKDKLSEQFLKSVELLTYLSFPIMVIIIIIAPSLFDFIYTPKWRMSVPYFQLLCVAGIITPLNMMNLNIIRSLGEGKKYLFMQVFQFVVGLSAILIGSSISINALIYGYIIATYIYYFVINYVNSKLLNLKIFTQLSSIAANLSLAVCLGVIMFFTIKLFSFDLFFSICIPLILYMSLYILFSRAFGLYGFNYLKTKLKK